MSGPTTCTRRALRALARLAVLAAGLLALAAPASAYVQPTSGPPFDGTPISHGLGPTYGETWCAQPAAGSSIANQQGAPLALIPYEAFGCLLAQFESEAVAAGVPERMTYSVIGQSDAGRDQYGVVVNAMETLEQQVAYQNWQSYRAKALTDPEAAQALLQSYGDNVKIPVFIENNIHGDEEEGADSMMQILRDLVTTPRGTHPTIDNFLDHAILVTIPSQNPDGRFIGQRANGNGYDLNRDLFVQSQPEIRNNIELQQQWLAPVMLATHGYVNPTLIDGLTKPHNPGLEYDVFLYWNQRRLDANQTALARIGMGITRPVNGPLPDGFNGATLSRGACANGNVPAPATNVCATYTVAAAPGGISKSGTSVTVTTTAATVVKVADTVVVSGVPEAGYNGGPFRVTSVLSPTQFVFEASAGDLPASGGGSVAVQTGPNQAEGWDDLGPFYTQTYGAFFGVDGSTLEMCSSGPGCNGRLGSKTAQYVGFWSAADFWIEHREAELADQVKMFVRGVNDAPRPSCCDDPLVQSRGFTEAEHNWMTAFPKGFVIPVGPGQRSDAEANRMAQWLLDNGIMVNRATADFTWNGSTFAAGSYVVYLNQPLRGLAFTALAGGIDYSPRISQLYAPPGAWSHGLMWGAETAEVPRGDASFAPTTEVISSVNQLTGGVAAGPSDWYSITTHGVREQKAILQLLRDGVYGEIAEQAFVSTTGGPTPAGSLIFPNDAATVAALDAAGQAVGVTFERNVAVPKPPTTLLSEAPKVAILANANAAGVVANNDTRTALKTIFGANADFVSLIAGPSSVQNAATDPLLGYDVIYNAGQNYPAAGLTVQTLANGGATSVGTTATITTTANHNLTVGATVTISGVAEAGYNGPATVTAIVANNRFSYTTAGSDLPASGAGTVATETRARLNAFFARGGGYIATSQSANNFTFLTAAVPALVNGAFTQGSAAAGGGTAVWANTAGVDSPLTGAFPARDYLYLPTNVTYFSATPTGSSVDGQYLATMADAANPRGPSEGYVAGLWLNRGSAASLATNNAAVLIHGTTNAASRYTALATNPFSRSDFERIWGWVVQSTLWSNLTDEARLDQTIAVDTLGNAAFLDPDVVVHATATSGRTVNLAAAGDCTLDGPTAPAALHLTGAGSCTVTASQPGNANYDAAPDVVQTFDIAKAAQTIAFDQPVSPATYGSAFGVSPAATSGLAVGVVASGGCSISGSTVTMTSGTVDCVLTASQAGNGDYLAAGDVVRTVAAAKAGLSVRPSPQNPARQYGDANPAFTAVLEGYVLGDGPGALTTVPTCSTTATTASPAGPYPITCGGGVAANYTFSSTGGTLTVTAEDASATYVGDTVVTALKKKTSAAVLLRATVRDSAVVPGSGDAAAGDIRTATVTFKEGSTVLCGPLAVKLVAGAQTTGAVNCAKTLNVGKHAIDVIVGGNYRGTVRETIEVSANPPSRSVRGLGAFLVTSPAGSHGADNGSVALFDLDADADADLGGRFTLTYRDGAKTYRIQTTAINAVGWYGRNAAGNPCTLKPSLTCVRTGELRGTGKLVDTSGRKDVVVLTGLIVQVTLTDKGFWQSDSFGITVWDGNTLVFSSRWNGAQTVERVLHAGILNVGT